MAKIDTQTNEVQKSLFHEFFTSESNQRRKVITR